MGLCQSKSKSPTWEDMDTSKIHETRTIKVSGISRFLKDAFTKYFQANNDTGPGRDVDRVFVCPDGKDCVLVEFSDDQGKTDRSATEIKIDGTTLTVDPMHPSNTFDEDVSKVWNTTGESPIEKGNADSSAGADDHDLGDKKSAAEKASRAQRRTSDKQQRHNKFDERRRQPNGPQKNNPKTATVANDNGIECSMFEHTKVKLNPDFLARVIRGNPSETKEMLGKEEVELNEDKGYLTGPWNAVLNVFNRLYSLFYGEDNKSSIREATETVPASSSELNCHGRQNPVISLRTLMIRYINTFHCEVIQELENVSKEIKFKVMSPNARNLEVVAKDDVSDEVFYEKYNEFINCYQKLYSIMHQKDITLDTNSSANPSIGDIVRDTRAKFNPVIVTFCQETSQITVYGEKNIVLKACDYLNDRVCAISKDSKNPGTENRDGQLTHMLSNKVTLIVYQGDITEEKTDAIVNPANETLNHSGGAAEAISKRGGKIIQDESDEIMKNRRKPLRPGDVETTTAGKLPCKFIVHAVGPRRSNHSVKECRKLLQKAVTESLKTASQNDAQTIAIPAISSGVFGVPVEVCAEVLFDTVEEFAKAAADSEKLKEIRFVNIDRQTTQVFEKEMRKRYGEAISVEKAENNKNGRVMSNGGKNATVGRNPNESSQPSTARTMGRGRGSHNNNSSFYQGNEKGGRKNNSKPGGEHPQPNSNASTLPKENDTSIKYPSSLYSDAVSKGSKNPNGNKPTADASKCPICLEEITDPTKLPKCGHSFCTDCISDAFKHQQKCPICSEVYGVLTGNQPPGSMTTSKSSNYLPGFKGCSTIVITYQFNGGTQEANHPNPGRRYAGTSRTAYLPDNKEGQKVLRLLRKAFDQKLTFTIGRSSTTGNDGAITWNDIHHKTKCSGGATNFGYPDPTYLKRVQEELAAKGIKE